jgi:hypothetical protein
MIMSCMPWIRRSSDALHDKHDGNFLMLVELLAKFDSIMAKHVQRVKDADSHSLFG